MAGKSFLRPLSLRLISYAYEKVIRSLLIVHAPRVYRNNAAAYVSAAASEWEYTSQGQAKRRKSR